MNTTTNETSDFKFGFQIGGFVDYSITDNLFVKAHLLFFTKGSYDKTETTIAGITTSNTSTTNPMYIKLPVVAGFGFDLGGVKPFINAGMYAAYGIAGKSKAVTKVGTNENTSSSDFFDKDINAFDFGARFGAGVEFAKSFILEFNYDLGLMNLNADNNTKDNLSLKNNSLSLTLGYRF